MILILTVSNISKIECWKLNYEKSRWDWRPNVNHSMHTFHAYSNAWCFKHDSYIRLPLIMHWTQNKNILNLKKNKHIKNLFIYEFVIYTNKVLYTFKKLNFLIRIIEIICFAINQNITLQIETLWWVYSSSDFNDVTIILTCCYGSDSCRVYLTLWAV